MALTIRSRAKQARLRSGIGLSESREVSRVTAQSCCDCKAEPHECPAHTLGHSRTVPLAQSLVGDPEDHQAGWSWRGTGRAREEERVGMVFSIHSRLGYLGYNVVRRFPISKSEVYQSEELPLLSDPSLFPTLQSSLRILGWVLVPSSWHCPHPPISPTLPPSKTSSKFQALNSRCTIYHQFLLPTLLGG